MQLSKFTDYAFRVLMYVSRHQDELHTIAGLAEKLNVSQNHLVKVVHFMAKQHWLITMRGKGGGIKVTAVALAMPVGEVIRTLQGNPQLVSCDAPVCILKSGCRLKSLLDEALEQFYQSLNRHTIAECVGSAQPIELIPIKQQPM